MSGLNVLKHHRWKLTLLVLGANIGLLLNLAFGTAKPVSEWQWLDILGEGGTALFMLFWVLLAIVWTWLKLPLGPGAAVFM